MFALQNYQQGTQVLVAACDPDLLGSTYKDGSLRLEVAEGFYDGLRVDEKELRAYLAGCTVANLVGERTVAVAVDMGLVEEATIRRVEGVPHAQMVMI